MAEHSAVTVAPTACVVFVLVFFLEHYDLAVVSLLRPNWSSSRC
jgi:hypothetical protein